MKNTLLKNLSFLSVSLLLLVVAVGFFTHTGVAAPLSGAVDGQQVKSAAQTVIITRNPEAVKAFARSRAANIVEERRMASGRSIITLNELPFSSVAAAAKQTFPDAIVGPNQTYQVQLEPKDENYSDQWNLAKISASKAWDITIGSTDTVIAVIDTGILFEQEWGDAGPFAQPDFPSSKLWTNSGEMGTTSDEGDEPNCTSQGLELDKSCNNLDDDDNGVIDDWQGWDFMGGYRGNAGCPNFNDPDTYEYPGTNPDLTDLVMQDNDPQPYSCDDPNDKTQLNKTHYDGACGYGSGACAIGHGTIVGSVAASETATEVGEDTLIAGIDHQAKLMNLRVLDGYGFTTTSRVAEAVDYATANGADVINMSLATTVCDESSKDPVLDSALAAAKDADIISVAASGNEHIDSVCFPASSAHTIAVGSSDQNDERAGFSNYGPELDVIAPGTGIPAATAPSKAHDSYLDNQFPTSDHLSVYHPSVNGTSLSTPHVAGQASLIKSLYPNTNLQQFKSNLIASSDKVADMDGDTRTNQHGYGRINLHKSVKHANTPHPDGTLVSMTSDPKVYLIENSTKKHIRSRQVFDSYNFDWNHIKPATITDVELPDGNPLDFREGTLLQERNTDPVYVVNYSSGTVEKRHITSASVFKELGYEKGEVILVSASQLPPANGTNINSSSLHPDGTLVKGAEPQVYLIEDAAKRHVISREAFNSHYFDWKQIKSATSQDLSLSNGQSLNFREGTPIKASDPAVYVVNYQSGVIEKRHLSSRFIFDLLGYKFNLVIDISDSQLPEQDGTQIN